MPKLATINSTSSVQCSFDLSSGMSLGPDTRENLRRSTGFKQLLLTSSGFQRQQGTRRQPTCPVLRAIGWVRTHDDDTHHSVDHLHENSSSQLIWRISACTACTAWRACLGRKLALVIVTSLPFPRPTVSRRMVQIGSPWDRGYVWRPSPFFLARCGLL
jgi:hypothetical protein